jgi:outer membrane receptor protein involved in Fe transport
VDGFEAGVKAQLPDRRLSLTASAYTYNYKNLQVSFTSGTTFQTNVANGANARVKGIELAGTYSPPGVDGLSLNAAVNLNSSKYTRFPNGPCYGGQQFSGDGRCADINPDPAATVLAQDFTGRRLAKAPLWAGQLGFNYRTEVTADYQVALVVNSNFSSGYETTEQLNPLGYQKSYITFDGTVRFGKLDGPWELALIARNITNKIILASTYDDGATFGTPGDVLAYIHRPRQVMVQLTVRPEF